MHAHLQRKSTCWSAELCIPLHLTRHRSLADVLIQIVPNVVSSPVLIQCEVSDFKQLPQRALAAPRDHRQLHLFQQLSLSLRVCSTVSCHSWAKANSTKELRLYSTRKRNYKPHVPEEKCPMLSPQNVEDDRNLHDTLYRHSPSHGRDPASLGSPLWIPHLRSSITAPVH